MSRTSTDERLTLETARLRLTALSAAALEAWIDRDADRLEGETDVLFEASAEAPPLLGDDLPRLRNEMLLAPEDLGWWVWLVSRLDDRRAVGACGLGGPPYAGAVELGYSVYPAFEGQGFATEASGALVAWTLGHPEVRIVRAVVPTWHVASIAVARKLGMHETGHDVHPEVGEVAVYETVRGDRPSA